VLGYVTPWNAHGYDVAKSWGGKFSLVAPVWLQAGLRIRIHSIRIQHFKLDTDPDPGFDDQKCKKNLLLKKKVFGSKTTIYLSLGLFKNVQVTEEVLSSQKRASSTSKHEMF
jgi:hypothetical protein